MGILDLFKKNTRQEGKVLGAGATLYPDKITIETVDRLKAPYGVVSPKNITVLKSGADHETLGKVLRHHLTQSKDDLKRNTDIEKRYRQYLEAAGFKSIKDHYKNALHLMIHQKNGKISIGPTINGGATGKNRGFLNTTEGPITVEATISDIELGDLIRSGWSKCEKSH
ncbi:MAG TPA: contact-dependent growth inhibition system immunity protein [Cyclobacteriaceae bacterium]|nr:contact-dependent growth inhibition system immunity protein [Cyclobacteriaceae bacterium]